MCAKKLILHTKAILHPTQHGFQKVLSCASQLVEVFQKIGVKLGKGHDTDILIYLYNLQGLSTQCAIEDFCGNFSTMVFPALYLSGLRTTWSEENNL